MHVDLSFSYLLSAATASFDKKSFTGTAQAQTQTEYGYLENPSRAAFVPLQEPVSVLAFYVPHTQMQV
jgi:hypothetical protein